MSKFEAIFGLHQQLRFLDAYAFVQPTLFDFSFYQFRARIVYT
jgi:hypothetical protein